MARAPKETFISSMKAEMERAQAALFIDFTHLTVLEADALRGKARAAKVTYRVVKNSLMARVLDGTSYSGAIDCLKGSPTGVMLGFEDPVTAAKVSFDFAKDCEHFKVKGGVVDNQAVSVAEAEAFAKLPSKEELQGSVVALAQSPGRQLASQLKAPAGRLLGAIEALEAKLQDKA